MAAFRLRPTDLINAFLIQLHLKCLMFDLVHSNQSYVLTDVGLTKTNFRAYDSLVTYGLSTIAS